MVTAWGCQKLIIPGIVLRVESEREMGVEIVTAKCCYGR